jgi:hypothetical protein
MGPLNEINPLIVKGWRERCRPGRLLSWGLVVSVLCLFTCLIGYYGQVENELSTPEEAARGVIIPLLIIQAIILIFFGVASVAGAVAQEREERLLDYQRMTPMRASAKIFGYLIGLPIREYVLFAITLPFVAWAVWRGGFPVGTIVHYYFVLFLSVLLYHSTGMVAGMVSNKPRWAGYISQGLVVVLYLVLPNLSWLGFTVFEFMTIRPVLFGLVAQQADVSSAVSAAALLAGPSVNQVDAFRPIPLFNVELHPTLYTVIVQGLLLTLCFLVVQRNWINEQSHNFSKRIAYVSFGLVAAFVVGSVWPILQDNDLLRRFVSTLEGRGDQLVSMAEMRQDAPIMVFIVVFVMATTLGLLGLFTLLQCTPSRHRAVQAVRQARRRGRTSPGWNWDGASAVGVAAWISIVGALALAAVGWVVQRGGVVFEAPPPAHYLAAPVVLLASVVLIFHGLLERYNRRVVFIALFVLWVVPALTTILLFAAFEGFAVGSFVALPNPMWALYLNIAGVFENAALHGGVELEFLPPEDGIRDHHDALIAVGTVGAAIAAVALQANLALWKRRLRAEALEQPASVARAA